jgi:hypothetical protein
MPVAMMLMTRRRSTLGFFSPESPLGIDATLSVNGFFMSTSRNNNQTIKASAIRPAFAEIATGTSKRNGIRNSEFKSIK